MMASVKLQPFHSRLNAVRLTVFVVGCKFGVVAAAPSWVEAIPPDPFKNYKTHVPEVLAEPTQVQAWNVVFNNHDVGQHTFLLYEHCLYGSQATLRSLNLSPRPTAKPLHSQEEDWYALSSIPNLEIRIQTEQQQLALTQEVLPLQQPAPIIAQSTVTPSEPSRAASAAVVQLSPAFTPVSATTSASSTPPLPATKPATLAASSSLDAVPLPIPPDSPTSAPTFIPVSTTTPASSTPTPSSMTPGTPAASNPLDAIPLPNTPTFPVPPPTQSSAATNTLPNTKKARLLPLAVSINKANVGDWTLLEENGTLYASEEAFDAWRLDHSSEVTPYMYRGQKWYPLTSITGFEARMDWANQSVELYFSPKAFAATRLATPVEKLPEVSPAIPAIFLNYDLNYDQTHTPGTNPVQDLGALTELGTHVAGGVLTSSYVGYNLTNDPNNTSKSSWQRLETTYTRDLVEKAISLRVGDANTRASNWGSSLRFGGIQVAKNFGLTPGFITQPVPTINGVSSTPSTMELYINDALRQVSSVPTGPFAIDNFPLISGGGEARVVVRDLLGRETVIVQPFFTHTDLLEEGLSDWSVEAGSLRNDLGSDDSHYGTGFASGLFRHGFSKSLTLETQEQWSRPIQNAGLGISYALPFQALGQAALSLSHAQDLGQGNSWMLGVEKTSLRQSLTLRYDHAGARYRQVGMDLSVNPYASQISGSYSYNTDSWGGLGIGIAQVHNYNGQLLRTSSLNYSIKVSKKSLLSLTATHVNNDGASVGGTTWGVSWFMPLDGGIQLASSLTAKPDGSEAYISASKNMAESTGLSWRALTGSNVSGAYSEGGAYYQTYKALWSADIHAGHDQNTVRLGMQGALVAIDGHVFAARSIQDSFALVEVPGYPNVGIGLQGGNLTETDSNGFAFLPRLIPYERNYVRIDANQLPIHAELDTIEEVVVPPARSGVKVVFPVRSGRGALLRIVLDSGEVAPAGATIELEGDKETFYVARRGEAFITGLQDKTPNTLHLTWKQKECSFKVELPPSQEDEIPRLGPFLCSGVSP